MSEKIRTGATEILFGGEESMQKICLDAVNTVDLDFRQDLVKSVVVAGGTSMLLNLAPRLRHQLDSNHQLYKILCYMYLIIFCISYDIMLFILYIILQIMLCLYYLEVCLMVY